VGCGDTVYREDRATLPESLGKPPPPGRVYGPSEGVGTA